MSGAPVGGREQEVAAALAAVHERIAAACAQAGRDPAGVGLLAVTKTFPASDAALLLDLGCTDLGEAREQEATPKVAEVARLRPELRSAQRPRWTVLGRLQRNKARAVSRWAAQVQSVDSPRLLDALDRAVGNALEAGERSAPLEVLLQVSLDGDPGRGGVLEADLDELADRAARAEHVRLRGLMAVAPRDGDPEVAFARLAALSGRVRTTHPGADALSAGMSGDLEAAVAHGSTCVRVGTALLGPRPLASP